MKKILLASSSKYRRRLMDQLLIAYDHASPDVDEAVLKTLYLDRDIMTLPLLLAKGKAESLISRNPGGITIGCDQMAIIEGHQFDKPGSIERAVDQLMMLQGKTHQLITALAVHCEGRWETAEVITHLTMRPLTEPQVRRYVELDTPLDSAGAYKMEQLGVTLFEQVQGPDPSAIVGLPLIELCTILNKFGAFPLN